MGASRDGCRKASSLQVFKSSDIHKGCLRQASARGALHIPKGVSFPRDEGRQPRGGAVCVVSTSIVGFIKPSHHLQSLLRRIVNDVTQFV